MNISKETKKKIRLIYSETPKSYRSKNNGLHNILVNSGRGPTMAALELMSDEEIERRYSEALQWKTERENTERK